MTFKDLQLGNPVYILDKDIVKVNKGTISSVTPPHAQSSAPMTFQQVVDITVNAEGKTAVYEVHDNVSVAYSGNLVISCDKDYVLNELKAIKAQAEQTVLNIDKTKNRIVLCDKAISELDDAFREKQQYDARFSRLEAMVESLVEKLS